MRTLSFMASMLVALFLLIQPGEVHAKTWKRLCVSGGATGGANNHTWQRVNTTASGGGTWKKAGGCAAVPQPQPVPIETIDLSGIPTRLYSAGPQNGRLSVYEFHTNGQWRAAENDATTSKNSRTGAYLINGAVASNYEIYIDDYRTSSTPASGAVFGQRDYWHRDKWLNLGQTNLNETIRQMVSDNDYFDNLYGDSPNVCPLLTARLRVTIRQIAVPANSKSVYLELNSTTCG